jgi:hypothetical protein
METLDLKLADWTAAYGRLKEAQANLNAAGTSATKGMRDDVAQLQREAEGALASMQIEFDLIKNAHSGHTDKLPIGKTRTRA